MAHPISNSISCRPIVSIPNCISDYSLSNSNTSPLGRRNQGMLKKKPWDADMLTISTDTEKMQNAEQIAKIRYSLLLLAAMMISSSLMTMMAAQFWYMAERGETIESDNRLTNEQRIVIEMLHEVSNCLDVAAFVSAFSSFLCSALQMFFALKILKGQPFEYEQVLKYLRGNSFTRFVAFSFFFLTGILFIVGIIIRTLLSHNRGSISKGVCVALGICALLLCTVSAIRSVVYWTKTSEYNTQKPGDYKNFSTLV